MSKIEVIIRNSDTDVERWTMDAKSAEVFYGPRTTDWNLKVHGITGAITKDVMLGVTVLPRVQEPES